MKYCETTKNTAPLGEVSMGRSRGGVPYLPGFLGRHGWRFRGRLGGIMNPYESPNPPDNLPRSAWVRYSIVELAVGIALVATLVGLLAMANPGIAILVSIVAVPVAIRTFLVLAKRRRQGLTTTRGQKWAFIGASTLIVIAMLASLVMLIAMSMFLALLVLCFSGDGSKAEQWLTTVMLASVALVLLGFTPIIWSRWKRDTTPKPSDAPPSHLTE